MKRLLLSIFVITIQHFAFGQTTTCNPDGDLLIFANYDGGVLNINVDQDINNLKIGVVTYEPVIINITGQYATNVQQVIRAGYTDTQHDHCGQGIFSTAINGPEPSNYSNIDYPPATLDNPNGYNSIICAYSCDNGSYQGGCNTIDQVIDYFENEMNGTTYSLVVQYCCFENGNTYSVSGLANQCCVSTGGSASVTYTGTPYCSGLTSSPPPNVVGTQGGSFSASDGLVIDPISGVIDPSSVPEGTYTIFYSVAGCPGFTSTAEVEIGNSLTPPTGTSPQTFCGAQTLNDLIVQGQGIIWYTQETGGSPISNSTPLVDGTTYYAAQSATGCESTGRLAVQVEIGTTGVLSVTPAGPITVCFGENATLSAQSGYDNYTWSNGQTGSDLLVSTSGTFSVSATDNSGCTLESAGVQVIIDAPFSIGVTPNGVLNVCDQETQVLTAQSGFQNYVWSNNTPGQSLTVTSSGGYSVSADNANGCPGNSSIVNVNFDATPVAEFTYVQGNSLYEIDFTCPTIADTYFWDFGSGNTSSQQNPSFVFLFDDFWPVTLIVSNECGADTLQMDVEVIKLGIESMGSLENISLSPNPGNAAFNLTGKIDFPQEIQIECLDLSGRRVMLRNEKVQTQFNLQYSTREISTGTYMIVITGEDFRKTMRWIKQSE